MSETILVTGACGYIGRHVIDELSKRDVHVLVADPMADGSDDRYQVVEHSIFDTDVDGFFEKVGSPDRVIHLAWRDGFNHGSKAHLANLSGHVDFVTALAEGGTKSISIMGSMHEVGYWEGAIDENTPCNPQSFYGIAKNALRQASKIICSKNDVSLKWLRGYYIVGDDASNHSIFAKIIEKAQAGEKAFPFTSGKNKYDFIDVNELARQIVAASLQDQVEGEINCCSGKPVSLGEQVEAFIKKNGFDITLEYGKFPDRPYDSPAVWGDATRINEIMSRA